MDAEKSLIAPRWLLKGLHRTDLSVQQRLVWVYRLLTAAVVILTGIAGVVYQYVEERHRIEMTLQSEAAVLRSHAKSAIVFADSEPAREVLDAALLPRTIHWAAIQTIDGRIVSTFGQVPNAQALQAMFINRDCGIAADFAAIRLCDPIDYDDKRVGSLVLEADLQQSNRHLVVTAVAVLLLCALLIVLSDALFKKMSRVIMKPIRSLISVARRVSETGDFKQRVAIASDDEIGQLSRDFNNMLASLEDRESSLRDELEERLRVEAQLDNLAHFDQTTGLPNRHYFSARLQMAIAQARNSRESVGLLFIDVDNFKWVNDSLGHKSGDHLLSELGRRFKGLMREGDVMARFGGDEFAVVVEQASVRKLQRIAEKITESLLSPLNLEGQEVFATVSIGIALYPQDAEDQQLLLSHADIAMYSAKSHGKNGYAFYSTDMSQKNAHRLAHEAQLRRAITSGQFELYFQPIVDAASHRIQGAEALIRWNHPERGVVLPWEFIPLAEENGLIVPIGFAVAELACRQIAQWHQAGIDVPQVSINVSARQLDEAGFVSRLLACIADTGCPPARLCIELTESTLMSRHDRVLDKLMEIRRAGMCIAIDDFGTGYSSMAYLKSFPINRLKIDRSFVIDILDNAQDCAITQAMIALGRALGMEVVAEGVETAEQAARLADLGCTALQGYCFGRPMRANAFADLIAPPHATAPSLARLVAVRAQP